MGRFSESPVATPASVPRHSLGSAERGDTKPTAHPENWDEISCRNVGKTSDPDAAVCPRKLIELCGREYFKTYVAI